jgi:N-acyl-D-amino-acid deacylase
MLDVLIKGARLVDGTGGPWRYADVAVAGDRIVAIGRLAGESAGRVVEADGRYLTPGFIDIHTHSDYGIIGDPECESAVRQGATTNVIGNCGLSAAPVAEKQAGLLDRLLDRDDAPKALDWRTYDGFLSRIEGPGVGMNVVPLVGHGSIRLAVLGYEERPPTAPELDEMRAHTDEAMRAGCFGMSTGLVYPPGCFADTDEIVALAEVVASHGGLYTSHIRGERETVVDAVRECLEIAERSGCRVQISHNAPKFGGSHLLPDVMALWEDARARGMDVTVDNDTHTDFAPALMEALPQWVQGLEPADMLAMLADPAKRAELKAETKADLRPAFGPAGLLVHDAFDRITLLRTPHHPENAGRTIEALAKERGTDPWDTYFDVIIEERSQEQALFDYIDIEVIKQVLRHPLVMICSDGWVLPKGARTSEPPPYMPCTYGEFPGVFERFVVNEPVLRLEEAVMKMTSMPAAKLQLADRGIVAEGMKADLVLLDLPNVRDRATNLWPHTAPFENYPHEYPEGIDEVWVNGVSAVREGEATGSLSGSVIRRGR